MLSQLHDRGASYYLTASLDHTLESLRLRLRDSVSRHSLGNSLFCSVSYIRRLSAMNETVHKSPVSSKSGRVLKQSNSAFRSLEKFQFRFAVLSPDFILTRIELTCCKHLATLSATRHTNRDRFRVPHWERRRHGQLVPRTGSLIVIDSRRGGCPRSTGRRSAWRVRHALGPTRRCIRSAG